MSPTQAIWGRRLYWLAAAFLLTRAALFVFTTAGEYALYQRYALAVREETFAGLYQKIDVEYPPLSVLFGVPASYLAELLPEWTEQLVAWRPNDTSGTNPERYQVALGVELFAFDIACLLLVVWIARRVYPEVPPRSLVFRTVLAYTLTTTANGLILFDRQDLVLALFPLLALAAFVRGWPLVAYAVLTVGVAYKLIPLLFFPLWVLAFAAVFAGPGSTRRFLIHMVKQATIAGAVLALYPLLSYLLWGPRSFVFLTFHSARGLQLEAPVAWLVFLFDHGTEVGYAYFSHTLRGALADRTAAIANLVMPFAALLTVVVVGRGFWRAAIGPEPPDRRTVAVHLITGSLLMWVGFILFNKVGSPQYLIWIVTLVPLLPWRGQYRWIALVALLAMVTSTIIFPCTYPIVRGDFTDDPMTWTGPTRFGLFLLFAKWLTLTVTFLWLAHRVWHDRVGAHRHEAMEHR